MKHLTIIIVACAGAYAGAGHAQSAPGSGDWALGRWNGQRYDTGAQRSSLQRVEYELTVEKNSNGYSCLSRGITYPAPSDPVVCSIDEKSIQFTTSPAGGKFELIRNGDALEGKIDVVKPYPGRWDTKLTR